MNINTRIKTRRKALGITQDKLAKLVGISQNSIHKIEDGTTKKPRNIIEISRALKCDPEWLLNGKGDAERNNTALGPDIRDFIPLINWVQAGAWETIEEVQAVDAERFPCPVKCSRSSFVLKVQGISMEPAFRDGELIFVDPEVEYRHNSYVVARLDDKNESTFKQLIIESGNKFLKPANPNWPEQIIPINGNCTIVGVVVFSGRII